MNKGYINKIIPFSSVDGPGNRTAIFMQGCNFNCIYCHNPETIGQCNNCGVCINDCPQKALRLLESKIKWNEKKCCGCDNCIKICEYCSSPKAVEMTVEEVINSISKTIAFISGVTISGGECTLQKEFLTNLFIKLREMNISIFIDTNGSIPLWVDESFANSFDKAMVDLKSFDEEEHLMLTGCSNRIVLENIQYLNKIDKLYEIRAVIVPDILNNIKNVNEISKLIVELNPQIRLKLIKYRPLGVRNNLLKANIPSNEVMEELKRLAENIGCKQVYIV